MRPLELRLKGLRSWRSQQVVSFRGLGLFAIVGETGAGKSSLLEAIVYALYNASTFSGRDVRALISDGEQTMRVSLEFEAEGERWRVTRSTSVGGYPPPTHQLVCLSNDDEPPVEKEGPVNRRIEALVGLNLRGFTSAVLLPQGRFQTLLTSSEGDRSSILKGIFRLDELGRLRERADSSRRAVEGPIGNLRQQRGEMLQDPAAVAEEQAEVLRVADEKLVSLRKLRDEHDEAACEAQERAKQATEADASAVRLAEQAAAVPHLDEAVAAEVELTEKGAPIETGRVAQLATRDKARRLLAEASAAEETVESLTRSCQVLAEAGARFSELATGQTRLRAEAEALGEAERKLEDDVTKHAAELERLTAEQQRIADLEHSADEGEERQRLAVSALAILRQRTSGLEGTDEHLKEALQRVASSREAEVEAKQTEEAAQAELASARTRFEEAQRANSAAAAVVGVRAGEACPVCARSLPEDFEAPPAPDLEQAHERFHVAEAATQEASRLAMTTEAQRQEAERLADVAEQARETAEREAAKARTGVAATALGEVELEKPDTELLDPLVSAAREARKAANDTVAALAGDQAACNAKGEQIAGRRDGLQRERERIARESEETQTARARLARALALLPASVRTESQQEADLANAAVKAEARLGELRELTQLEARAIAEAERTDRVLAELADERLRRVLTPRRAAEAQATALRALLESLPEPRTLPGPPAHDAELTEHVTWIDSVVGTAHQEAAKLDQTKNELQEQANAAATRRGDLLDAANETDREHDIRDANGLREAIEEWAVRRGTASTLHEQAKTQIELAAKLDERIRTLETLKRACDEVARLTTDGKFIRWLVARRQRALLEVGSDRLSEITGSRYGFADDFQIVDRRTGQPRSAKTLSGGETFQASLALALGMVELAARSGGRIGSFYLDEGFGSLDPNALDEALTALEQRAQSGQLIAVISHVSAVAERLQRVLRVTLDSGGSQIEDLDAASRKALVAQELAEAAPEIGR